MLCLCPSTNCLPLQYSIVNKSDKALFGFKNCRRRRDEEDGSARIVKAVEKDSEFEIERDKAREALRKLDDQLQSLSTKQVAPPKIRARDLKQYSSSSSREKEEEISGSFLTYAASFLLLFTIMYNVIFLTVIKPAVDGPDTLQYADNNIIKETREGASQQDLSRTAELRLGP